MFNQEQKESFINEYLRSKVVAETSVRAAFKKTELFEIELGKDAANFTREEILNMFAQFKAKSVNSLLNYSIILKHYTRWCGKDNSAYETINKADVVNLIDKNANIILSREDLDDAVHQLLNWSDKAIVELLWEGVSGKNMRDIHAVSEECVQGDKLIINGKEFPLTIRLQILLPKAFNEDQLMTYGTTLRVIDVNGKGRIYKERNNARGVNTEDSVFRFYYRRIQLFRDYLGMPGLTMKNISASGLLFYLQLGIQETKLGLREFLKTKQGEALAIKYGFSEDYYIDSICQKFEQYI